MKNIEISSESTPFSIGTYGSWLELDESGEMVNNELEYFIEQGDLPEGTDWEQEGELYDVDYRQKEYLQALAQANTEYISELIKGNEQMYLCEGPLYEILSNVELVPDSVYSPRQYNFSTDSHTFTVDYSPIRLAEYIARNNDEYLQYVKDRWTSYDGFWSFIGADDLDTKVLFVLYKIWQESADDPRMSHAYYLLEHVEQWEYVIVSLREKEVA